MSKNFIFHLQWIIPVAAVLIGTGVAVPSLYFANLKTTKEKNKKTLNWVGGVTITVALLLLFMSLAVTFEIFKFRTPRVQQQNDPNLYSAK